MKERVSIRDVAREAGVSIATVSRVINKSPSVKKINRDSVEQAIKKLKFSPNVSAQRLVRRKSNTIGLVIPRFEEMFYTFYISQIIKGVGAGVYDLKLDLLLHLTEGDELLNLSAVDGVIFADIERNEEQLDRVLQLEMPCVVMNYYTEDLPVSCIAIDNRTAARDAVKYLIKLGHRKIATITGHLKTQIGIDRLNGYIDGLTLHNISVRDEYIAHGDFSKASAHRPMLNLMNLKDRPTAIFVASDDMALEAIETAWEVGIKIPQEISIIGFDDSPAAVYSPVPLTTVRQPLVKMGAISVRTLEQLISGKLATHKKIKLPTELIFRASCQSLTEK